MSTLPSPGVGTTPLSKRFGKTVGLAILSYKAPKTARASIENHLVHHLYRFFDDVVICFQSVTDEDFAMAEEMGIRAVGREENLGIQSGFRYAWSNLKTDYILILENDIPVCVSEDSLEAQLTASLQALIDGKVDVVRLRNRFNPGEQNRFASMYSRFWPLRQIDPRWNNTEELDLSPNWKKALRRLLRPGKATRWCGRSPYIEQAPDTLFPRWISKIADDFFVVDSYVLPWTNLSSLLSHDFMGQLLDYADAHPSKHIHTSDGNTMQTLETPLNCHWWRIRHFRIGMPEGIFTHRRLDRQRTLV